MADIASVLKRLEAATVRLEEIVGGKVGSQSSPVAIATADPVAVSQSVVDYDHLIASNLAQVVAKAKVIGGVVDEQIAALSLAFAAQRAFLVVASTSKKPSATDLSSLLADTQKYLQQVVAIRDKSRASPFYNHLSIISEGVPALGWVAVEPTPVPYIGEMKDSATFYSNKVVKDFKDKDQNSVDFARAFISLLTELQAYVKKYHTTGVAWDAKGGDVKTVFSSASHEPSSAEPVVASAAITDYDNLIVTSLAAFIAKAHAIGGIVDEQAAALKLAFVAQRSFLVLASASKKPSTSDLPSLLTDTQKHLQQVVTIRDKSRASPFYNHLSVVSEGVPALGWVAVEPTPVPYIGEMKDSATFYSNKVVKDFKDKDQNSVDFARAYVTLLTDLQAYVKKYYTTGVAWNPKGGDAKTIAASSGFSSSSATASVGGPPPPPAPTTAQLDKFAGNASSVKPAGTANLFSALNKEGLTAGLRKVDKSEMTHKNPELRASSVVAASASEKKPVAAPVKAFAAGSAAAKGPPKCALEGNKWVVENQLNESEPVVIKNPELRHSVYIYNCQNSTIKVEGKVNAVTLDNCKKTGLLIDSVVSTCDIVNCKSVQVQITGRGPTVAIDKTDGCQLYLSKLCVEEGQSVEVLTAMSTEVNVLVEGEGQDGEFIERPVPEQIKSTVKKGSMVTEIVEHKA